MHRKSVYFMVIAVVVLIVLGCVMLFSTSAFAKDNDGNPNSIIVRQFQWLLIGGLGCLVAANIDYHFWQRTWAIWFGLSVFLLVLCLVPAVGHRINGSARWLKVGPFTFQPSEMAKFAAVTALAWWFSREQTNAKEFLKGFVYPIAGTSILLGLIAPEVDMGSTALIAATMFIMMFVAGSGLRFILPIFAGGLGAMLYIATHIGERQGRLMAFMDLEKYREGAGLQQWMALLAFGSGGVEGLGLGNGRQKMAYLPFAHTDFIFPMIGEELGLRCTLLVVFCYVVFVLCGTMISTYARDRFGMLLGFGLIVIIALQA
ncbi:MAG: FtsW/RodA/SpoVE family cell cycle protein, partial [Verrucomicrobiota bacterium]